MEIMETARGHAVDLTLTIKKGLHARPSAKVAQAARKFKADILLIGENGEVDAKSMVDILTLSCPPRARLRILAKGADAREALEELHGLLAGESSPLY